MIDPQNLLNRFTYHAPREGQPEQYQMIRNIGLSLATYLNENCPDSRELSLAITHLEEVVFWANAAIARHQIKDPLPTTKNTEVLDYPV